MTAAPQRPTTANGVAACANHPGFTGNERRMIELMKTRLRASHIRSESAVVSTNVLLRPDALLIIRLRMSSPARAGRKLLPKYPAQVAQKAVETLTGAAARSKTRQRSPRRNSETLEIAILSARRAMFACARICQTPRHWIPRNEK